MTEQAKSEGQPAIRIVVAGGGTAGWMAAAAIAKTMGRTADVTLVESEQIGTVGVGEATIPPLITYNRLLDIKESDFMRATKGTFKLGIQFENWKAEGETYFHSFGLTGKDHWTSGFQHFWKRGRELGHAAEYGEYCMELMAARAGRFAHLQNEGLNYAYHLDSALYARFLRDLAETHGARRVEGRIDRVELDGESGNIAALHLEDGEVLAGDLFLDCTGFRALLIGQALHTGYDDWTHFLPCDSAIAVQTRSVGPAVPYTRSIAHDAGWQWRIPLQHRVGNGIVYCSRYLDRDTALERLLSSVEGETLTDPNFIRFQTGARRRQWVRNCVAIGLSGGFMEPLESTSIHLIQRSVLRLLRMMPTQGISPRDVEEFNAQADWDMANIRDFLILHYNLTERRDSPFWRYCAGMEIPDTLKHRMELFRETGRIFRSNDELFAENSWIQVMMGQGLVPETWHPIVGKMSDDELRRFLASLHQQVATTVAKLPEHEAYIGRYCASAG